MIMDPISEESNILLYRIRYISVYLHDSFALIHSVRLGFVIRNKNRVRLFRWLAKEFTG